MKDFNLETEKKIETGFKVPEAYFETFEERLFERIAQTEVATPIKVVSLWQRKTFWVSGIAAAVVLALGTWLYFENNTKEASITSQEYLAYSNDITTEDIAQHLTDEDITALETELTSFDADSEKYINEYLN